MKTVSKPVLTIVGKPKRRTWTQADYKRAVHSAKQEMLLQQLVSELIRRKLSPTQIASAARISRGTVNNWMTGETKQGIPRTLNAVGRTIGWSLEWNRGR